MTRRIFVTEKTGFKIKDPSVPVVIRDPRGLLFYSTEDLLPRVKYFNLPAGEYFVDSGDFAKATFPRDFKLSRLNYPDRVYESTGDFDVIFASNPNKCTIFWDEKKIVFDKQFENKSIPETMFILYHEMGHRYYDDENESDLYASNMMKVRGYNPSQIALAQMYSLSSKQIGRKIYVNKNLINTL